jgi:phosphate transport system permease protein
MTDISAHIGSKVFPGKSLHTSDARTKARNAAETRFRAYGIAAIAVSLVVLLIMFWTIFSDGVSAFRQGFLTFPVQITAELVDPKGERKREDMAKITTLTYGRLLNTSFAAELARQGISVEGLSSTEVSALISKEAPGRLRALTLANPEEYVGKTVEMSVFASGRIDGYLKGRVTKASAVNDSNVTPEQLELADRLILAGVLASDWNSRFLLNPDSSDQRPEAAGLGVAMIGSAYMMLIVLVTCLPVGVAASIYLEEFAPKNVWTDIVEVNIANLAAVPSIVYGILGLAIFINFAGFAQSSSLVGGLVLSLMTLPTVIIATRASIRAVPPSIRDAALGIGASKMQTVFHHVLPLAMPGILTGTILGLASALGETAPLLLIGMVAFVDNYPGLPIEGFSDPATALPVQVYGWASRADPAFIERSAGAIIVLLFFLLIMNLTAIVLRRRFERRW